MKTSNANLVMVTGKSLRSEKGSALWLVAVLLACMSFALTAAQVSQFQYRRAMHHQNVVSQADNVARAGLADALNWFRRQLIQPVNAFQPLAVSNDTIDESVGLVKEYSLNKNTSTGHLWARYELHKNPSGANRKGVEDTTAMRVPGHATGEGLAWTIESVGYTYLNVDSNLPFNQLPNRILATTRASMEIRTLTLMMPGGVSAAAFVSDADGVSLRNYASIQGGAAEGLAHFHQTAGYNPLVGPGGALSSTRDLSLMGLTSAEIEPEKVFGASMNEIKILADHSLPAGTPLPVPYPPLSIVYIDGDATFDGTNPLRGNGVLIINGNLDASQLSHTFFNGVIYVRGNANFRGATSISGTLFVGGTLTVDGAGDSAEINHFEPALIATSRQILQRYRTTQALQFNFSAHP